MKRLINILCLASTIACFVSCALIEDEERQVEVVDMHLERDTAYVMVGDTLTIRPVFSPESVTLADIYWASDDEEVLTVEDNTFIGVSSGWAKASGTSVSRAVSDTCHVYVLPRWELEYDYYPYETVFYADIHLGDIVFNPDHMMLGAFINGRISGFGILREAHGIQYIEIRVNSEFAGNFVQPITFALYDRQRHIYRKASDEIDFDGETHGSLSSLYHLSW